MNEFKLTLLGIFATINMFITDKFGVFTPLLWLTVMLMVSDLITRAYAAGARSDERVESKKVGKGLYRKLGMAMLIGLSLLLDVGLKQLANSLGICIASKIIFTALTLAWIFVREFISNLENLQHAGIDLPPFIVSALSTTKKKVDQLGNTIISGEDEHNDNPNTYSK